MNRLIGGFRSDGARPANVAPKAWASVTNPQDISMTAGSRSRHGAPPARRGRRWAGGQPRNPPQPRFGHWRRTDVLRPRPPRAGRLTSRRRSANEGRLACPRGGQLCGPPSHAASGNARRPGRSWATAAACSGPGARTQAHSRRPVAGFSDQWAERRGGAVPSRGGMAGADAAHARWTMDMRVSWDGPRVRPGPGFTLPGRVRAT
jgi:hypothetical protein